MNITDLRGKVLKIKINEIKNAGVQEELIDISELTSGIYYITILSCEEIAQSKFCVAPK